MRMGPSAQLSAADVVNTWSEHELGRRVGPVPVPCTVLAHTAWLPAGLGFQMAEAPACMHALS